MGLKTCKTQKDAKLKKITSNTVMQHNACKHNVNRKYAGALSTVTLICCF